MTSPAGSSPSGARLSPRAAATAAGDARLHSARGLIEAQLMAGVFREALQKVKIKGGEVAFEEFLEVVRDTFAEGDKQQRMLEDARRIRSLAWAEQERKADLEHRKPKPADATPNGDQDR